MGHYRLGIILSNKVLQFFVTNDKKISVEGIQPALFLSLHLVQGQINDLGSERVSKSEFIEVRLHSTENKLKREKLIFPSFNFDFIKSGEHLPITNF